MIFCRVASEIEGIAYGEGLTPHLAYKEAEDNANWKFGGDCFISFWEAKKLANVKVEFVAIIRE